MPADEDYEVCGAYCAQLPGHTGRCDDGEDLHAEREADGEIR